MTHAERQALREKHKSLDYGHDFPYCFSCEYLNEKVGAYYSAPYPCDVIKVLDALDEADRRAVANYERGYDDGYRGSVADAESDNWAGGNDD